jgi:cysteine synthase
MGTSGTVLGAGRYLKERNPEVRVVVPDPGGSVYLGYLQDGVERAEGSSVVEGVGIGKVPAIFRPGLVDEIFRVEDPPALAMNRILVEKEGMFLGGCAGLAVAGAVQWARRAGRAPGGRPWNIVIVLTDTGLRYLSKLYNPEWLEAQGLA